MIKEKNQKIQVLRGIAIIAVVLTHTCFNTEMQIFVRPFVNFAVALFLFLSGYLTNTDTTNWKAFYKKRIIRILIPYTFWTIFYTTNTFHIGGFDFKKYIINFFTAGASEPLYYVFMYIELILLTPLFVKLAKSKYKWTGFLITPVWVIANYFYIFGAQHSAVINQLQLIIGIGGFVFYYLGLLVGNDLIKKKFDIRILVAIYVISILIQTLEGFLWYRAGIGDPGTQMKLSSVLTSCIALLIASWYLKNEKEHKGTLSKTIKNVFAKIGDYSLGIYFFHTMVIMSLGWLPWFVALPYGVNSIIVFVLSFICVFIASVILRKRISRWLGLC